MKMNPEVLRIFRENHVLIERGDCNEVILNGLSKKDANVLDAWLNSLMEVPPPQAKALILRSKHGYIVGKVGDVISRHEDSDLIRIFGIDFVIPVGDLMYVS